MGYTQGVSGLQAASSNLDTIGNNIANSQTTGFKSGRTEFADLYASAKTGLGVQVAGIDQNFNSGSLDNTGRHLDVAIDGGGFFRLVDSNQIVYSRDGAFQQTKDGHIANAEGALLTGYNVSNFNNPNAAAAVAASGDPVPIQFPPQGLNARATTQASLAAALDSGAKTKNADNFDSSNSDTYNWSTPSTVYDSQGNAYSMNLYFIKKDDNSWQVEGRVPLRNGDTEKLTQTELKFNANGNLESVNGDTSATSTNYSFDPGNGTKNPLSFTFDFAGSSQDAQNFSAGSPRQDGYAPGALTGISMEKNGMVRGSYANGQSVNLAQVALASFANEQGLDPVSDNAWVETAASGQPALGIAGTGQLGNLLGGALEKSNVDLSQELVNMIVAQRAYQANAQTIKTQNQVLQTAVNLAG